MKKIAYQGIEGSFSFLAAKKFFKNKNQFFGKNSFKEVFEAVEKELVDFGIIPIENSIAGTVHENLDWLKKFKVKIQGEILLKINHCLLVFPSKIPKKVRIKILRKVFSHPKALEQCSKFFEKYNFLEKVAFSDTAKAAKFVKEQKDLTLGAIASKECAKIYNLQVLLENIQDNPQNFTRFLLITSQKNYKILKKANKCSLIFTLPHFPGSLYSVLEILAKNKINLTKIESRPIIERPFEYFFFVDFVFKNQNVEKILKDFKKRVNFFKNLGYYEGRETFL